MKESRQRNKKWKAGKIINRNRNKNRNQDVEQEVIIEGDMGPKKGGEIWRLALISVQWHNRQVCIHIYILTPLKYIHRCWWCLNLTKLDTSFTSITIPEKVPTNLWAPLNYTSKGPIIQQLKGTIMSLIIEGRKKEERQMEKQKFHSFETAPSGAAFNNPENILNNAEAQGLRCTHMHKQTFPKDKDTNKMAYIFQYVKDWKSCMLQCKLYL